MYGFKKKNLPNNKYYENFNDLVSNADWLGSDIGVHFDQVETILASIVGDPDLPTDAECKQAQEDVAKDQYLAMMFLLNCDCNCYGNLVWDIENKYMHRTDMYPHQSTHLPHVCV